MTTTLTRREPRTSRLFDPFQTVREELESLWSRVAGDGEEGWLKGRLVPSLDLSETANAIDVRMDLPGIKPEEIDVQLNNGVLTVSGERKEEKEEKDKMYHRVERRRGSFSRSVTLPASVMEDKVEAQYRDGVLTISMQKTEESKSRKIKVKS